MTRVRLRSELLAENASRYSVTTFNYFFLIFDGIVSAAIFKSLSNCCSFTTRLLSDTAKTLVLAVAAFAANIAICSSTLSRLPALYKSKYLLAFINAKKFPALDSLL